MFCGRLTAAFFLPKFLLFLKTDKERKGVYVSLMTDQIDLNSTKDIYFYLPSGPLSYLISLTIEWLWQQ